MGGSRSKALSYDPAKLTACFIVGTFAVVAIMITQFGTKTSTWLIENMDNYNFAITSNDTVSQGIALQTGGVPMETYISVVMLMSFLAGICQIIVWTVGGGNYVDSILPDSLVSGFMTSASLTIILSQIKHLLGERIWS